MSRSHIGAGALALTLLVGGCMYQSSGSGTVAQQRTAVTEEVTFYGRVAGILQENCQTCHRPGGGAPFALVAYEDAYRMRTAMQSAVNAGRMPPWYADPAVGHWANDRSLSAQDRRDLLAWIDAGAPAGDARLAPPAKQWTEGWNIGEPTHVVTIPAPISVPAEGRFPYQNVAVKTEFTEDKWITAMEVLPTARGVVHHVLVFMDPPAAPGERVRQQSALEGFFAAYGPGGTGVQYPQGAAKRLPAGATLRFQLHYEPDGQPHTDQTVLGFVFSDQPPPRIIETGAAANARFAIPADAPNHAVSAEIRFDEPTTLFGFVPHMHILGKSFRYDLIHPDGREEVLLNVPNYNFHMQLEYFLKEPLQVAAGSRLRATGWFDNSASNPHRPNPPRAVPFGPQTDDEMMIGYFHYLVDNKAVANAP
jgi:mono/diheme cytochrome c family protein